MPPITYSRKRSHASAFQTSHSPTAPTILKDQKITRLLAPKSPTPPAPKKPSRLTQLTLDLGPPPRRHCPICNMHYTPSHPPDAALHAKFHAATLAPLAIPPSLLPASSILSLDRRAPAPAKALAHRLLAHAEAELGAPPTAPAFLWSQLENSAGQRLDRHRLFVAVRDARCAGVCLARKIQRARVVRPTRGMLTPPPSSPLAEDRVEAAAAEIEAAAEASTAEEGVEKPAGMVPAYMGIARIWVAREARGQGVAVEMLEEARRRFALGRTLRKEEVAFSAPTESGLRLARRWYGKEDGWLVYEE